MKIFVVPLLDVCAERRKSLLIIHNILSKAILCSQDCLLATAIRNAASEALWILSVDEARMILL
jgi:hypothetical protein